MRLIAIVLPVLLVATGIPCGVGRGAAEEEATDPLYHHWVSQYRPVGPSWKPDENDPMFVELLRRTDADLFFLQGLRAVSDPVRRLSRLALGRLKTDRSFESLVQQTHSKNMFVRESAVETLAEFRQSRCVPILLRPWPRTASLRYDGALRSNCAIPG